MWLRCFKEEVTRVFRSRRDVIIKRLPYSDTPGYHSSQGCSLWHRRITLGTLKFEFDADHEEGSLVSGLVLHSVGPPSGALWRIGTSIARVGRISPCSEGLFHWTRERIDAPRETGPPSTTETSSPCEGLK